MKKRLIAMLLALSVCVGMTGIPAFAAETDETPAEQVPETVEETAEDAPEETPEDVPEEETEETPEEISEETPEEESLPEEDEEEAVSEEAADTSYSSTCGPNLNWSPDTETGELIITRSGKMTSVPWFNYASSVRTVSLPAGLTSICDVAFYGCTSLTSITIPSGVTSIGGYVFYNCSSLTAAVIPDNVTSIETGAFSGCTGLTNITMSANLTDIGDCAFYNCKARKTIVFTGSAPTFGRGRYSNIFFGVTANAYYPADDPTWDDDVKLDYSGKIIWNPSNQTVQFVIRLYRTCFGREADLEGMNYWARYLKRERSAQ